MPLVEQHDDRRPESCEVCQYLQTHPLLDRRLAHSLTKLAGWQLLQDLREADGGPLSMLSIYTEQYAGAAPGKPAEFGPEHWTLALLAAPEIKLSIEPKEKQV